MKALQISTRWSTRGSGFRPIAPLRARATYTTRAFSGRPIINKGFQVPRPLASGHLPQSIRTGTRSLASQASAGDGPEPTIHDVFESNTGSWQYVVADPATSTAVIIDPVLDYDPATLTISTDSADGLLAMVKEKGYKIDRILETHVHADHLTAASYIQERLREQGSRPPIGIGKRIEQAQKRFGHRYQVPPSEYRNVFDKLFDDDETFMIGQIPAMAIHLPGHTPDHLGYKIGDNVFCGDSIFHVDIGTARCDFPGGDAYNLFNSAQKLLSCPDHVRIWTGHDYPSKDRGVPVSCLSVGDHKELNKHLRDGITEEHFVATRQERDKQLAQPRLLHPSLQFNIRGGRLPKQTETGHRMFHLPLKLPVEW